jgi:hypothetical protein
MGNEASKDGSGFPSQQDYKSSSNKRSRVVSEVAEGGPALVEMTSSFPKSKSKEAPEKPKTQKQLNQEINHFKCLNSSCCKDQGGCFLRNFFSSDQSCILMDNAINVLQLFREKTRVLTKEEEGELALSLFKTKCTNLTAVISPTDTDSTILFGEDGGTQHTSTLSIHLFNLILYYIISIFLGNDAQHTGSCDCDRGDEGEMMYCGSCSSVVGGMKKEAVVDVGRYHHSTASSKSLKEKRNNSSKRFEMKWSVDLDPGWLPDNKKTLQLCRESFSFLYGFSPNLMKKTSKKMKEVMSADIFSIKTERAYDHRSYFGNDYTIEEIQNIFDANGVECNYAEKRAALLRASNLHIDSMVWMEEHFYQYESQPNAAQIHIDATFKRTIWQEYCKAPLPSDGRLTEVLQ